MKRTENANALRGMELAAFRTIAEHAKLWFWRSPRLTPADKLVYARLIDRCYPRRRPGWGRTEPPHLIWPSQQGLASDLSMSRRSVIRALDSLERTGAVSSEPSGRGACRRSVLGMAYFYHPERWPDMPILERGETRDALAIWLIERASEPGYRPGASDGPRPQGESGPILREISGGRG